MTTKEAKEIAGGRRGGGENIKAAELYSHGITHAPVARLEEKGVLLRNAKGIYALPADGTSEAPTPRIPCPALPQCRILPPHSPALPWAHR